MSAPASIGWTTKNTGKRLEARNLGGARLSAIVPLPQTLSGDRRRNPSAKGGAGTQMDGERGNASWPIQLSPNDSRDSVSRRCLCNRQTC